MPPTPPPIPQEPIPVRPLSYVPPAYGRPGILTAVGVISIVLGSMGILLGGLTTLWSAAIMATTGMASGGAMPAKAVVVASSTSSGGGLPAQVPVESDASEDGMSAADRKVVVDALDGLRAISSQRQKQIDALLEEAGKKILPISGEALTQKVVAANVTDSGQFPSGGSGPGAEYFVFGRGRIEVNDQHAAFYPSGAGEVIRASATEKESSDADAADETTRGTNSSAATTQAAAGALNDKEIRQVIATIEAQGRVKLTAAQAQGLRARLSAPGQILFVPATSRMSVTSQINSVLNINGNITVYTNTSVITLAQNGLVTVSPFGAGMPRMPRVMTQSILVVVSTALSLVVAIFLLVAGIQTIRNAPSARKLHLIYIGIKIPLVIASMCAWWWFWYEFTRGFGGPGFSTGPVWGMSIFLAVPLVLSLIYPVGLLIVLNTRGIKNYYSPTQES